MSSFYYCNDCKKPVDLVWSQYFHDAHGAQDEKVCKECGSTNWHAEIDMGKDGYKQVKE